MKLFLLSMLSTPYCKKASSHHHSKKGFYMSLYVDGFVIPVPKSNLDEYKKMAEISAQVWLDHGALSYTECMADDVPDGQYTSFPKSVQSKEDETVFFSYIEYKSREHRDQVNQDAMKDPRIAHMMDPNKLPFDGKRLIWGGFTKMIRKSNSD